MRALETAEGGGDPSLYYLAPAVGPERMIENMKVAIARGLPEVRPCRPHGMTMTIVGGGPSVADTVSLIEPRSTVCAINGSLRWLADNYDGEHSFACGVCDAGEHVADMIDALPGVRYYVASVVDPRVFDKLLDSGCEVWLWHVSPNSTEDAAGVEALLCREYDDWVAVGGGCTMGLRWFNLGYLLGYRHFHAHGMDSSFRGGATHAYDDVARSRGHVTMGGRETRMNFVAQVHDFAELLEFTYESDKNVEIEVFGDGLLQDEWRAFREQNPQAFRGPRHETASRILRRLPAGDVEGAEVGVFAGSLSRQLLKRGDLRLTMVDSWEGGGAAYQDPTGDWHAGLSQEDQDRFMKIALQQTEFSAERRRVVRARSAEAAAAFPDQSLDFVYLDGDHSYSGCAADVATWRKKIKPGGLLCGHDYGDAFPGVKLTIDEMLPGVEVEEDTSWFIHI